MLVPRLAFVALALVPVLASSVSSQPPRPGEFDFDSLPESAPSAEFVASLFKHANRGPLTPEMQELATAQLAFANGVSFVFLARRIADPAFLADVDRLYEEFKRRKATPLELIDAAAESGSDLFEPPLVRRRLKAEVRMGGFVVEGKVVDANDRPVPEAIVVEHRRGKSTRTNEKGEYRFNSLAGGTQIWIAAWREGDCSAIEWVDPDAKGRPVVLRLLPEAQLVGKVVDSQGNPIENCALRLLMPVGAPDPVGLAGGGLPVCNVVEAATDATGKFRLLHHPAGARVTNVTVRHQKFRLWSGPPPKFNDDGKQAEITLESGCEISGIVVDETGKPIANAVVKRKIPAGYAEAARLTGLDGAFSFGDAAPGEFVVTAEHRSFARGHARVKAARGEPIAGLKIIMTAGDTIEGTAVSMNGRPLRGVKIGPLVPVGASGRRGGPLATGGYWSDDEGNFVLGPLPADEEFHLFIDDRRVGTARPGQRGLRIQLR